jgi:hypothetical protein
MMGDTVRILNPETNWQVQPEFDVLETVEMESNKIQTILLIS